MLSLAESVGAPELKLERPGALFPDDLTDAERRQLRRILEQALPAMQLRLQNAVNDHDGRSPEDAFYAVESLGRACLEALVAGRRVINRG